MRERRPHGTVARQLDQHAATIRRLRSEGATLATIVAHLQEQGVRCASSSISTWVARDQKAAMRRAWEDRVIGALKENNDRLNSVLQASGDTGMSAVIVALEKVALQLSVMLSGDEHDLKLAGADMTEVREQLELISQTIKPILDYRKVLVQEQAGKRDERRLQDATCEAFLKWYQDQRAREIADSIAPNEEKIRRLRHEFFSDVDALERSGKVVLPSK